MTAQMLRKAAPAVLCPLASLAALIACWQAAVVFLSVPEYILPAPLAVWHALADGFADGTLWPHIGTTLGETVLGYGIGSALAVVSGALLAESRAFERFVFPLLAGLQAMPKVALGPVILVWCGYGSASKVVLVILVCFFPLFVNTVNGLKRADPDLLDACRAFSASRTFLFLHVKLPGAAPEIFSGLQIGVSLALIGAVVGEFLSSQRGLGYLISASSVNMNVATMFAGAVLLAVIGVGGAQFVRFVQRRVVFWERRDGGATEGG